MVLFVVFSFCFSSADDRTAVERLSVFGKKESLPTRPGSAHVVSEAELNKFNYDDIHQVLRFIPGVYLQDEDGFGLRPNIGLRGGHPHRSKKVVLMEDGVLIAPAPYSAPAAYYFPHLSKISSFEVFKGTPSTQFGPNSIGGAINMVTRINEPGVKLGVAGGNFGLQKYTASVGIETFGDVSLDLARVESTGFKALKNKSNTGFTKNNINLKWDKYFVAFDQNINFKINWSDEVSNETYAGLTKNDFNSDAYKRYTGTERDKMDWTHRQFFLSYALTPFENLRTRMSLYHHEFERSWDKLNGFGDGVTPAVEIVDVLKKPDLAANNYYYRVLKGEADSGVLSNNRDVLQLGDNQRQYFSQGLQLNFDYELDGFVLEHLFKLTYRLHKDGINRFHEANFYNMSNGVLVDNGSLAKTTTLLNEGRAESQMLALTYETTWDLVTLSGVARFEDIEYSQLDKQSLQEMNSDDQLFAPGLGLFYQVFANTGFLLGVNKAFTPVGPGQANSILPEEAINYELGIRHTGAIGAELIGFYSDYKNLLGTCTQSGGCAINQLDQSFNGGKAEVLGAELLVRGDFKSHNLNFPLMLTATYTKAEFKNSFVSTLNEWGSGRVQSGDPIPYIPELQAGLVLGVEKSSLSSYVNLNYMGKMADQAVAQDREYVDGRFVMGASVNYKWSHQMKFQFRVDNLLDETYVVSQRPFGLRPGSPRSFRLGVTVGF